MIQGTIIVMFLFVQACDMMEMRGNEIQDVQEHGPRHHTNNHQP